MAPGPRLKACPDCRWVFFDHPQRHKALVLDERRPDGAGLRTIAKVRRFRERRRHPSLRERSDTGINSAQKEHQAQPGWP